MGTPQLYALTSPLLTTASGQKMGKSLGGAIWLNAEMLSAYDFWQYWRNTEDADVERFLKLYTTLPLDEIARLAALEGSEINEAKRSSLQKSPPFCTVATLPRNLPKQRARLLKTANYRKIFRQSVSTRPRSIAALAFWR